MAHVLWMFLATLFVVSTASYMYSNKIVLDNKGNYNVSYNFNASCDMLEFLVEARATGWVGFGVAENAPNRMIGYDVAIGGVSSNGAGYLKDYLTIGYPFDFPQVDEIAKRSLFPSELEELDRQQDWMLLNSSEENGVTTLRFNRKLNTTDQEQDVVIQQGMSIFVTWAYHSTSDVDPEIPQIFGCPELQHTARGYQNVTFILATVTTETTPTPTAATASVVPPVIPSVHFPNVFSFDNINYNVSWKIIGNTNALQFVAEVKAAGMMGLGVAHQAPNNMVGYNVFLEGNLTGSAKAAASVFMSNSASQQEKCIPTTTTTTTSSPMAASVFMSNSVCQQETVVSTTTVTLSTTTTMFMSSSACQQETVITTITVTSTTTTTTTSPMITHASNSQQVPVVPVVSSITPNSQQVPVVSSITPNSQQVPVVSSITPTTSTITMTPGTSTQFPHSFDNNLFRFLWIFDDQNDMISFHLRVKTTGWVGFGFAKIAPNNMQNYDVIVGGFKDGQGYLNDYYTRGRFQPRPDTNQDYKVLSASEEGGYTELIFERPRDTNDSNDIQFEAGEQVHIVWAYAVRDITTAADFVQHSNQGWSDGKFILVPEAPIPTKANKASLLNSSICGLVSITIVFLNVLLI